MASEINFDAYDAEPGSPSQTHLPGKKTWEQLRKCVRDSKKVLVTLAGTSPSSFVFRNIQTESEKFTRIYFLGVLNKSSRENTLVYVDVPSTETINSTDFNPRILDWQPMLDSFRSASSQLSKEEQLMRERKRVVIYGITSFEAVESIGKFIFPANNSLYLCQDSEPVPNGNAVPTSINTYCPGARLDPKICPTNTELLAFIHDNDIWVTHLGSGCEKRLTFARKGTGQLATDTLSAGVASFVVQEEFDRHTGYWWRPCFITSMTEGITTYQILYEEVDESEVEIINLFAPSTEDHGIDEYRYPRAGTTNAKSCLKIVEFEIDKDGEILDTVIEKQLVEPLSSHIPWSEYMVRAGWTIEGKYVHVQLLDRLQEKIALVLLPIDHFQLVTSDGEDMIQETLCDKPPVQILYQETTDIWINTHDSLYFFPQTEEFQLSFIWSSEKSGYRHLYLIKVQLISNPISSYEDMECDQHTECPECTIIQEVALTSGDWEVLSLPIWVDENHKLLYFTGLKDTPLETHLYCISYLSPSDPVRLTPIGYSHIITMNNECNMFVSVYSNIKQTPRAVINTILHNTVSATTCTEPNVKTVGILMEQTVLPDFRAPEMFNYQSSSGYIHYGMFYKPHDYQHGQKYPTVLFVYGGPQVQLVTNSFKGLKFLRLHTLASEGYAVVVLDCRGSARRGIKYESILKHSLGIVEIDEQVEGLYYLNSVVDFIDINRIAIHGWSYGGYLSLMGLAQRPDVFKLAIAGAPVVNWTLYDTGYTERYLGLPDTNKLPYQQGSVLQYLQSFPDEENRLLIIHGLIDENVHFHHSNYLINALVKQCKPYRLQVYPNERHGIRGHEASEHYKTMVLSFLQNHL